MLGSLDDLDGAQWSVFYHCKFPETQVSSESRANYSWIRVGDVINGLLAYEVMWVCCQVRPKPGRRIRTKMFHDIRRFLGAFPLVGLFAAPKLRCNTRNLKLRSQEGKAEMEMQKKQQANVRANWEIYRGIKGIAGVWILFWTDFGLFNMAIRRFLCIYCFMRGLAFGSLSLPPEGAPA